MIDRSHGTEREFLWAYGKKVYNRRRSVKDEKTGVLNGTH